MTDFRYWALDPPTRWQAGTVGVKAEPFYFDCGDCGAKEPPIAGILSTDGTFKGLGVLPVKDSAPFVRPAMFCADCFHKRVTAATKGDAT
jgi:hypothetical protein